MQRRATPEILAIERSDSLAILAFGWGLIEEPGWVGMFTRDQAVDAIPNGTRIVKVNAEMNDAHPLGTTGTVLGSFRHPDIMNNQVFYFVEWTPRPRVAVGVMHWKIGPV